MVKRGPKSKWSVDEWNYLSQLYLFVVLSLKIAKIFANSHETLPVPVTAVSHHIIFSLQHLISNTIHLKSKTYVCLFWYVLELKKKKLNDIIQKSNNHYESDTAMIRIQALGWY